MRVTCATLAAALFLLPAASAHAQDCCGGKTNVAGAGSASGAALREVRVSLAASADDPDGKRTLEKLRGLTAAKVAMPARGWAILTFPTAFADFPGLEKALAELGLSASLLDPVRIDLRLAQADGKVDAAPLVGTYAMSSGVLASAPDAHGIAVWADPALVDLVELVSAAEGRGLRVEVSHAQFAVKIPDRFCPACAGVAADALAAVSGVLGVNADSTLGSARVLALKGRTSAEALSAALAAAGFDGKRAEGPAACAECHNRK